MAFERFDPEEALQPKEPDPVELARKHVLEAITGPSDYRLAKPLLPGIRDPQMDANIRHIISERFNDKTDKDISRELGYADEYVKTLEKRKPEAFEEARRLHINAVVDKHAMRMAQVTTFLSDTALDAVRCLREIINDKDARETTRRQAAVDVLNLFYIGRTKGKHGKDAVNSGVAVLIQNISQGDNGHHGGSYLEVIAEDEVSEDDDV